MIIIGMGANLMHPVYGEPVNSLAAAVEELVRRGVTVVAQSSWYRTAPVPVSDQPWYVNAVLKVETDLSAADLLALLHEVEREFGRVREVKWEARVLDLDLLAYDDLVTDNRDKDVGGVIPHPHMHERAFVLVPLDEIAPDWTHPVHGKTARAFLADLGDSQVFDVVPAKAQFVENTG
ncbi:2-amino-4-hydroxy-6-hydroxymethyldihydropteridine diphosphokinase [Sneathiella chinensis]|uniref:2-amino-4-hydroxy-6-hydroxymethyldihydropteridine pyrophosphokinase n=1 Tax=Sneathiella chinensis TaxID=349750 RepID=A0ABQ5U5D2_9PROT|nr:2-amino-4-hydroxy-6-hydroxymethyldihydropteridine diphosphokinase [Sneathiella chinensis]GLQ07367.1 7,8-dihydro-6-hydroxymethylpterin-pyrophosphokina se [Sneathiella chinensis]